MDEEMRRLERAASMGNREAAMRLVLIKIRARMSLNDTDLFLLVSEFGVSAALKYGSPCELAYREEWFAEQVKELFEEPLHQWAVDGDPGRIRGYEVGRPRWNAGAFMMPLSGAYVENDEEDAQDKFAQLERYLEEFDDELAQKYGVLLEEPHWELDVEFEETEDEYGAVEGIIEGWKNLGPHHILAILENMDHDVSEIVIPDKEF